MKYIIIILILLSNNESLSNYQISNVDTNKRFNIMIEYITKDSVIKQIIYTYYPEIVCFDLPEIVQPDTAFRPLTIADIDYYLFIKNDTNKSIRYQYDLIKKIDSINLINYKNKKYSIEYTNYKKSDTCTSIYDFKVFFNEANIWVISIIPKVTQPGLWRMISYIFVFDEYDNISRVKTYYIVE